MVVVQREAVRLAAAQAHDVRPITPITVADSAESKTPASAGVGIKRSRSGALRAQPAIQIVGLLGDAAPTVVALNPVAARLAHPLA